MTHNEFRRQGFAKAILDDTISYAWENGCTEIMLLSGASLTGAHKLYKNLGFNQIQRTGFILHKPQ